MYGNLYTQYPQMTGGQYNPYAQQQQYMQQMQNRNANMLPPQQVIEVNGKASADSIQLAPNSSVIVADKNAPIVYICVSDGVGNVTAIAYDITLHQDRPPIDVNGLENRLARVENILAGMEEKANAKSNVRAGKSKSNDAELSTDQEYYRAFEGGQKSAGTHTGNDCH